MSFPHVTLLNFTSSNCQPVLSATMTPCMCDCSFQPSFHCAFFYISIFVHYRPNYRTNYRPISLLNYDLKIFPKCLTNRIKPLIADFAHEHQYVKPRKQISSVTTLLRDLWWDVCIGESNAYFISLDFQKAFDSVDQQWLFRVLQKMNFLTNFIQIIKSLNNNAHVKVLVNGFQIKNIQIQKDVRQRDPLSLYLFLLAVKPLVATINQNQNIEGLEKGRRRNIKCHNYADDFNTYFVRQLFSSSCF